MDAAVRRRQPGLQRFVERWSTRLPAAYFTRIVLAEVFERQTLEGVSSPLRVVGHDSRGEACYCHFHCEFECPRCVPVRRRHRGEQRLAIASRELRGWLLKSGKWLVCTVDRETRGGPERISYSTRATMPTTLCLDGDSSE